MRALNLRTEYLYNPMGIDIRSPRLMWNAVEGRRQSAYQIYAESEDGKVWDSGKVASSKMIGIVYPKALHSRQRINWKVRLWDEKDIVGEWSEPAYYEMGLLKESDWKAKWITGNYKVNKKNRYPVDCFRKKLSISKEIQKARLYITACGLYEARLDGNKIGNFCLAPGITDYRKRVQYQTYDLTKELNIGKHSMTVQLADGWYRGSVGGSGLKNQYGSETKFLAQLEINYIDGSRDVIITDDTWAWSDEGPIRFADNKDGEIIEAGRNPLYKKYAKIASHSVIPTASNNVAVVEHEHFHPAITTAPNGKTLLNFGQNIAGYISFRVQARQGQRLVFRLGEMLDTDGNLTLKNIQSTITKIPTPLQKIEYTCKEGINDYKTTFAVFGFQYAEVETEIPLSPEDVTAIAVYSDFKQTGRFESSNELLNRFVEATVWSAKGNHLDIPTDCPTRERHGWTGDAQIFFETAGYLFDYAAFAKKYLQDVYDWQKSNGKLPQIVPYGGVDPYMAPMNGSVGWSDVGILIPYRFWKLYGDREILKKYYDGMKKYANFMISRCGKWGGPFAKKIKLSKEARKYLVNCGQSYGEWAEPADVHPNHWTDMVAPHPEESTAYTANVLGCMAEISRELGRDVDAVYFTKYSEGCMLAYQELSWLKEFTLNTDRQARLVRPLSFGLLNKKQEAFARKRLLRALENYRWRLGTGFLSTPLILDVLTQIDIEAAYRLLENEEMPGWLFMSKNNATTIWESWEGTHAQGGIASLNHYSKGAVCEWLFKTMCGIHVDGDNHFVIAPKPGGSFTYAKASYQSIYGQVVSCWRKEDGKYVAYITIPGNTTADVILPDGSNYIVEAGSHEICLMEVNLDES